MCCFSRPVEHVSSTRIFARPLGGARQLLVYGMTVDLPEELAMVLPIPVPPGSPDDCVTFVDLSSCPTFLDDVAALFPAPAAAGGFGLRLAQSRAAPKLVVHDVGDFEASFVPSPRDFDRLDARFRLPADVWEALPRYADWGFCVFKLKTAKKGGLLGLFKKEGGPRKIHPMAFEFPRRDTSSLFFPTVHVHDGKVHPTAQFDHELYCQVDEAFEPYVDWYRSEMRADRVAPRARAWLDAGRFVFKRAMNGDLPNRDTEVLESKLRARVILGETYRLRMQAAWEGVVDTGQPLDPFVKKWIRVGEAERTRIRDAVSAELGAFLEGNRAAFDLAPYRHDLPRWYPWIESMVPPGASVIETTEACVASFSASNDYIEPQQLDVAFRRAPRKEVCTAIQDAFQRSLDRASSP